MRVRRFKNQREDINFNTQDITVLLNTVGVVETMKIVQMTLK